MTWDGENRLTGLELPDGTTEENVYRADGLRHKHVDSGGTIYPICDEQNVLLEKNADFATQAIYAQLPGIWGGAFSFKRGATHYFLLPDSQGHTRQTVNASETLVASYFYDAWGGKSGPSSAAVCT
jgi:YD repeat-containing protein